jgi:iron-sulfur cluster repair protein YtfE (RIC family)
MPEPDERPGLSARAPLHPQNPVESFEREHGELQRVADRLMKLLSIPVWDAQEARAVEEALRELRRQMPLHFLKEEHILFPELRIAGLLSPESIDELRRRHLAVEDDFVEVQATALALGVTEPTRGLRRQLMRAARRFKEDLDDLLRFEESATIIPGATGLPAEALERILGKLDAAARREELKQLQAG